MMKAKPRYVTAHGMNYAEALKAGYLRTTVPTAGELAEIEKSLIEPQAKIYGLRFPEKDGKTERDYMRLSYKDEDDAWR